MELDHVGVASADAAGLAAMFEELFDAPLVHEEEFDGMSVLFLELGGSYFELLEPHEEGAIGRYLDEYGPGIHHVAVRTDSVADALDTAREVGVELIDENPRQGAWGHEVAFLHPKSTGGVLVEFVSH
ncbi:methylmalonyl-CoA epimerase [Halopelagius inordinatus]|uniref:Methylmalonyl-CoA epimerase n=1 Tax=Halopelagius inordinatus TaxID=553467 RepID=A0A1I2P9U1_9EURY|nr:methylmalonyl-CoA epimerase [Halopelagius inordinatus]SFG12898.1 methylmalonyl-CoA epimerase [Halopelagius inordinatus]